MSYQNKWTKQGLYRVFTGKISGEEVLTSNFAIQGDPRFDNIKYIINDFTQIVEFEVSETDINKIAFTDKAASTSNPEIKIAIVATFESLLPWIKLYCLKMPDASFECKVFDKINDAHKWVAESFA